MTITLVKRIRDAALIAAALLTITVPGFAQYSTPTRDVDNAARQPVTYRVNVPANTDNSFSFILLPQNVPAGKRLVVEQVTGNILLPPGQRIVDMTLTCTTNGTQAVHHIRFDTPIPGGLTSPSYDFSMTTMAVRLYADPSTGVNLAIQRNAISLTWFGDITVSGYLVNLP